LAALLEVCQLGFYYYPTQLDKVPSGALVAAQKAFGTAMRVFQMLLSFLQLPKQALHTIHKDALRNCITFLNSHACVEFKIIAAISMGLASSNFLFFMVRIPDNPL
jgi:hypothetical protein